MTLKPLNEVDVLAAVRASGAEWGTNDFTLAGFASELGLGRSAARVRLDALATWDVVFCYNTEGSNHRLHWMVEWGRLQNLNPRLYEVARAAVDQRRAAAYG